MEDQTMAGWQEKDDLELTADDLGEMLAAGTPVEIITPRPAAFAYEWVQSTVTFATRQAMTFAVGVSALPSKDVLPAGAPTVRQREVNTAATPVAQPA